MINRPGYFIFIFPYFVAARDVSAESGKLSLENFFDKKNLLISFFKVSQKNFAQAV